MVKLEKAVIARLDSHGEKFEILVDPDLALALKHGENVNFDDLLAIDTVFKDSAKGDAQSPANLTKAFGTSDTKEIAAKIIREGEVQLTTEQRRAMKEAREKEVVAMIARNAMNPQTNSPHPPQRIQNAMAEAKINIDPMKSAEEQVPKIIDAIRKLIPISTEQLKIAVRIPVEFAGKGSAVLHRFPIKNEEWQRDGSLIAVLEIPAGLKGELFNELNHLTHGQVETKIIKEGT